MSDFAQVSAGASVVSSIVAAGAVALVTVKKGSAQGQAQGNLNGCRILSITVSNLVAAAPSFFKLYVVAAGVTPVIGTTVPVLRIPVPQASTFQWQAPESAAGLGFNGDVYFTVTGANPDNDQTNVGVNGCVVNVSYF
jgi:hypothetical protein